MNPLALVALNKLAPLCRVDSLHELSGLGKAQSGNPIICKQVPLLCCMYKLERIPAVIAPNLGTSRGHSPSHCRFTYVHLAHPHLYTLYTRLTSLALTFDLEKLRESDEPLGGRFATVSSAANLHTSTIWPQPHKPPGFRASDNRRCKTPMYVFLLTTTHTACTSPAA